MSAPTAAEPWVGRPLKRKEDPRLIMGRARYIDDINVTGQLWAAFVRSPEAHAKVTSIDVSEAKAYPGVHAVFVGNDLDLEAPLPMAWVPPGVEVKNPPHWALAKDEVHHVGDPVALVIGSDRYAVVDAAQLVSVEYEPLPVVVDLEKAYEGGDLVHADLGTNQCHEWSLGGGDLEAGFEAAEVVVERRIVNHRTVGAAIEPRGVLADYRAGSLTLTSSHPGPALPAALPGAAARDQRGPDPGDRARGRRRLRLQAADLRRGDRAGVGLTQARAADQVGRVAHRGHARHPSRTRPDRLREDRRHARRQDHRVPHEDPAGPGRVPDVAHADDPVLGRVRDERRLRHPGGAHRHRRRLHQQDADGRDPRGRPPRGDAPDRDDDRPARRRAGDGPARAAAQELHAAGDVPARDGDRRGLRLGRLPEGAGHAAGPGRLRGHQGRRRRPASCAGSATPPTRRSAAWRRRA